MLVIASKSDGYLAYRECEYWDRIQSVIYIPFQGRGDLKIDMCCEVVHFQLHESIPNIVVGRSDVATNKIDFA